MYTQPGGVSIIKLSQCEVQWIAFLKNNSFSLQVNTKEVKNNKIPYN
jgi:hypothetical protein